MSAHTHRFVLDRTKHAPIHLAAQGSWELPSLADFSGNQDYSFAALAAVAGFCYQENDQWVATVIKEPADRFSVKLEGRLCHIEISATQVELTAASDRFATWDEMITWYQHQIGLTEKAPLKRKFERLFCLDVHDFQGNLVQSFADIRKLKELTDARGLTKNSLFYLPGWDGTYDGHYPDYQVSSQAGGAEGLSILANELREAGAEVFLHMNHWGVAVSQLENYPELKEHRVLGDNGEPLMWAGATWCGATNPLYYIKPDAAPWMALLGKKLDAIETLGVKGFFLDQLGAFTGLEASKAATTFAEQVCTPPNLYGMEAPMVAVVEKVRIAQWWGATWSGVLDDKPGTTLSPLLADIYAPWAQMVGHLGTPAPYPTRYAWTNYVFLAQLGIPEAFRQVWEAHQKAHVLPTLRLDSNRVAENAQVLDQLLA